MRKIRKLEEKIRQLEEKINKISNDIGVWYWHEEREDDYGSPLGRKTYRAYYYDLPIRQAQNLLMDYLGVEIKAFSEVYPLKDYPAYIIVKKKKKKN